ncbi:PR-1-like protein [Corynespora cassiicola Philippines]|uniref:PR-1-like protein n=1 Tax=Corynespora cassiicola Philippines TaxID=1448308 RepID=A0A2T2NL78_CORCC|nr:PR-1-like protein [Corynespora cassiicola Philippines]
MKLFTILALAILHLAAAAPADLVTRADHANPPTINDKDFISVAMDAHWYWRRIHCAQDLTWDHGLAQQALEDAMVCGAKAEHKRGGSNLSAVSSHPASMQEWLDRAREIIHGWHEEEAKYPYSDPHYDGAWGHFSQVVWRSTSRVGCAMALCDNQISGKPNPWPTRMFCVYQSPGNYVNDGQFKENVWPPICPDPTKGEHAVARAAF